MDNIDLRRKTGIKPDFGWALVLITAAFVLGAAASAMLGGTFIPSIMSIGRPAEITGWICLAALLAAESACLVMPLSRVLCVLLSAAAGASAGVLSYLYSGLKLFSDDHFALAAAIFAFSAACAYISERVFTLSPRLRSIIRSDRRLRHELDLLCAVSAALALAASACAAALIL